MHMPCFSHSSVQRVNLVASWHHFCVLSNCFYPFLFNWHIGWLVRWSGALHMLVLAPWYTLKLSFQQRQWCCHCRHLNKKCCKYFASRYVLPRWQSRGAFVVQQEATESNECVDERRIKCFYAKIEKCRHEHRHTQKKRHMCLRHLKDSQQWRGFCGGEYFRKYNLMQPSLIMQLSITWFIQLIIWLHHMLY